MYQLYFYALICGGIISFLIILINLLIGFKILKLLFVDKILIYSLDNGVFLIFINNNVISLLELLRNSMEFLVLDILSL